jgi:hypothetical protein
MQRSASASSVVAGQRHDGYRARLAAQTGHAGLAAAVGQVQVQQHDLHRLRAQRVQRGGQRGHLHHLVAGLPPPGHQLDDQPGIAPVVLDEQDAPAAAAGHGHGSRTTVNQKPSTERTMDWKACRPTGLVT